MNVGDMLLFKKTGEVGLIVSKENDWYMLLHSASGIPNPSGFYLRELRKHAKILSKYESLSDV